MLLKLETKLGRSRLSRHLLKVEKSKVKHDQAGEGLRVYCKEDGGVKPGKLLGLFPGVIHYEKPDNAATPFSVVEMSNGDWLSTRQLIPYPNYDYASIAELDDIRAQLDQQPGAEQLEITEVTGTQINPYALGSFYAKYRAYGEPSTRGSSSQCHSHHGEHKKVNDSSISA